MTRRSSQRALAREIYRQMVAARAEGDSAKEIPSLTLALAGGGKEREGGEKSPTAQDLTEQDLTEQDLTEQDLTEQDLTEQDLTEQDLTEQDLTEQDLTERVRALYEHSAVPVAEIASVAGVTERTIYKYAAKEQWTPRYAWAPSRSRGQRAGERVAPDFVPVRGAGGRFIRRADQGKPFATGLKATDPAAAARAAAACRREAVRSLAAQAQGRGGTARRGAPARKRDGEPGFGGA
jgi:hypothetical protein